MLRRDKETFVEQWTDRLKNNQSFILTDYQGLKVEELSLLRDSLRRLNSEYRVIKNKLMNRVVKSLNMEEIYSYFRGPTAIVMEVEDPVKIARVLIDFSKEHENLKIKAGLLEGKFLSNKEIRHLASLPSRQVLLASVARGMLSPIQGFHNVLSGVISKFVYALEAIRKQKEG